MPAVPNEQARNRYQHFTRRLLDAAPEALRAWLDAERWRVERVTRRTLDALPAFDALPTLYLKPALLDHLRETVPSALRGPLLHPARHATQHHYRVALSPDLRVAIVEALRAALPAWRWTYETGAGRDGRAVARRLVEQAEEALTALGAEIPAPMLPARVVRVTPTLWSLLVARGFPGAESAPIHSATKKREVQVPDAEAFRVALTALDAEAHALRAQGVTAPERSRAARVIAEIEQIRAELPAGDAEPVTPEGA